MNTEKDNFSDYLTYIAKKSTGANYKKDSIKNYVTSINGIASKINYYLKINVNSIFDINDVKYLNRIYKNLFSIDEIIIEEARGNSKNSNAFKRYIEFRKFEQEIVNQELDNNQEVYESRTEGGLKVVVSKIAERDAKLRKSAIKIHKCKCKACGFDFLKKYGVIGKDFIEIHHCKPLSKNNGQSVKTNPKTDLIPLCSNCHRMVHRKRNVVLTLDELKKAILI